MGPAAAAATTATATPPPPPGAPGRHGAAFYDTSGSVYVKFGRVGEI